MITTAVAFLMIVPRAGTVTYHGPVDRLEVILAELGKQTGENLQPSLPLADLPMFLRCDNRPVDDVYAQLAKVVNGRWERDSKAYRLVRDSRDVTNEQREDEKITAQIIEKELKKKRAEVAKMVPFTDEEATKLVKQLAALNKECDPSRFDNSFYARVQAVQKQGPVNRALTRVIANMDPAILASLPDGIKVVFSDRPNPSQHALTDGSDQILARAIKDQNRFAAAATKYGLQPPQINGGDYIYTPLLQHIDPAEQIDRVWLSLFYSQGQMLQAELKLLNKKGVVLMQELDYVSMNGMEDLGSDFFTNKPKTSSEKIVKYDPDRKRIIDAFAIKVEPGQGPPSSMTPLPPFARELALQVDVSEPTKYFVTDLLDQATPPGPVAAIVDDQMIFFSFVQRKEFTLDAATKALSTFNQVTTDQGWTHLRPRMMGKFMKQRLSRKFQAQIIRTAAEKDTFSIEDQAKVAYLTGDKEFDILTLFFAQRIRNEMNYNTGNGGNYARLYGSLTDSQRRQAAGAGLQISNLLKPQIEILNKIVYGQYLNANYDVEEAKAAGENVSAESFDFQTFYNGVGRDATELIPNGYPTTALIKTSESTDMVVIPERPSGSTEWFGEMRAEDFASQQFYRSRPDIFTWISRTDPAPTKFRYAKRRQLSVVLHLKPGIKVSQDLSEKKFVISSPVAYSGLPAEFRSKVEASMADLKEQYKDAKPGQYGAPTRSGSKIPPR